MWVYFVVVLHFWVWIGFKGKADVAVRFVALFGSATHGLRSKKYGEKCENGQALDEKWTNIRMRKKRHIWYAQTTYMTFWC